jgi:hypothetical protein
MIACFVLEAACERARLPSLAILYIKRKYTGSCANCLRGRQAPPHKPNRGQVLTVAEFVIT